jgi:hypothetical protein
MFSKVVAMCGVVGAAQGRAPAEGGADPMAPRLLGSARQQALRGLQESPDCDIKAMQTQLDRIDDACCYLPNGNPLDCSEGPPVQCTATCAQTFLPFWAACRDASVYGQTDESHFDTFNTECDATFHNDQGDNSIGNNVLDPSLCAVDKKHTFAWVEISPLQMDHCIGATPEEQAACGVAPPRTGITTADVGTLIGFNDWTSGGRNTWAADDGWCVSFRVQTPQSFSPPLTAVVSSFQVRRDTRLGVHLVRARGAHYHHWYKRCAVFRHPTVHVWRLRASAVSRPLRMLRRQVTPLPPAPYTEWNVCA